MARVTAEPDDLACIRKCRDGRPEAFRPLVERYQAQAMGHALGLLGDREDARDAVQEAFVAAYRSLDGFDSSRRFYPWLYTILRNLCLKCLRKRPRRFVPLESVVLEAPAGETRLSFELERALFELSTEDRELVTLKHLDGLSYAELSERLGIPPGTVMSRLYHARCRLKRKLECILGSKPQAEEQA